MDMLKKYTEAGGDQKYLSAAAINSYMDCSLRFYFRYIARLPEPDTVTEEIDSAVFGNLLHTAAHYLYAPFTGKEVTAEVIDGLLEDREGIDNLVKKAFSEVLKDGGFMGGINLIIAGVLVTYLRQLLKVDRKLVPFRIETLEKKYFGKITVAPEGKEITVRTGGFIDRVDRVSGMVRVADYKTGSDIAEFKTVESLFERGNPKRPKAVFQTFLYAWLYLQPSGTRSPVSPVLYQVRKFFGDESLVISQKPGRGVANPVRDFNEYKGEFEAGLQSVLSELFDSRIGFSQAEDADICRYCPYSQLCHRGK